MADLTKFLSKKIVISIMLLFWMAAFTACATKEKNVSSDPVKPLASKAIKSISAIEETNSYRIEIEGNRMLTYTLVKKPVPLSVVLYFPETALEEAAFHTDFVAEGNIVGRIRAAELSLDEQSSKIEISLQQDAPYEVVRRENGLAVIFQKNSGGGLNADSRKETVTQDKAAPAQQAERHPIIVVSKQENSTQAVVVQPVQATVEQKQEEPMDAAGPAWVNRIDFSSEADGKSTLIIGTTLPVTYQMKKQTDTWVQLRLDNTNLPDYRRYPLITTRFESAVDRIIPVQKPEMKNQTIFSIELRESVPFFIEQSDNFIMVHFEASSIAPKPLEEANLPTWQKVMSELMIQDETQAPSLAAEETSPLVVAGVPVEAGAETSAAMFVARPQHFTGEKIALDFFDTDIKNVFRILREISGKNFAIDKDVAGRVTLTLDKPVPWDQVLDLVMKMNQLGMAYEGDIIRIATLKTLKVEEDLRAAKSEAAQKSKQQELALEPLVTEYIAVNYSNAQTEILPHLQNILTKERGRVTVDARNNQIIITDVADTISQAREIVTRIDRVTPQVIIEARIVEVNTDVSSEFGFDWNLGVGPSFSDALDANLAGNMAMNFPAASATSGIGFTFDKIIGTPAVLNARLNALESTGNGKIISSPKIVTLDNKKAKIKQGLEYPYLERDDTGGSSVSFKDIDLLLEVTPHVTPDNRVSLQIKITKNDIDSITNGVPSLSTNEAETELLVNDGDTIVIGGILKTRKTQATAGFPWLSRIPVLGWFFKTQTDSQESNELLIFITPKIVQLEQRQLS
jgi:type IV pilus assembly protein PilQ